MSVALAEIVAASRQGGASFVAESAGYIALALADGALRSLRSSAPAVDGWTARLDANGDLVAGSTVRVRSESEVESSLRLVLGALLRGVRTPSPNLSRVAERSELAGLGHLVVELEAALVPVNRKAARRSLSRLCRETQRAIERGGLRAGQFGPAAPSPAAELAPSAAPSAGEPDDLALFEIDVVLDDLAAAPPALARIAPAPVERPASRVSLDFSAQLSPMPPAEGPRVAAPASVAAFVADTPPPILEAATAPEPAPEPALEPLELSAPAPRVQEIPTGFAAPRVPLIVPALDVLASGALDDSDGDRDETPTRIWAPVVLQESSPLQAPDCGAAQLEEVQPEGVQPGDSQPWDEWDGAVLAEQTIVDAPCALPDFTPPPSEQVEAAPRDAQPPYPRLSRHCPSDIGELLARHGWARKTDDAEVIEELGRLAEREHSLG